MEKTQVYLKNVVIHYSLFVIHLSIRGFMTSTILPIHVTAAISTYLWFVLCVVQNVRLRLGYGKSPEYAVAFCEAGIGFALITMGTGAYWAQEAWGSAWVWEPRLTGMFLMTLFFVSWRLAVAILGDEAVSNKKLTATLIVLGLPSMAFTHLAAKIAGGIHPADMSHLSTQERVLWPFLCAGAVDLILGAIWVFFRTRNKKGERISEAQPEK